VIGASSLPWGSLSQQNAALHNWGCRPIQPEVQGKNGALHNFF
jgi:hypothetical protein